MDAVSIGWANASSEITLVLLTAIAPSSALAYVIVMMRLAFGHLPDDAYRALRKLLWIPLVLCMGGLIASATHLGNPSNALYVLSRVGASPLSNEVFSLSVFLGCAALYWLAGFAVERKRAFDAVMTVLTVAAAAVSLALVSFAYNVDTIVTWSNPIFPATIALSAGIAGPLVAHACFDAALPGYAQLRVLPRALVGASIAAGCVWLALHALLAGQLDGMFNHVMTATDLVPMYVPCLGCAAALLAGAWTLTGFAFRAQGATRRRLQVAGIACAFAGIFVMRLMFYMLHMTAGISV